MSRDEPFAGGVRPRLRRLDRELSRTVLDAQCRDWAADRPDRVGFARLGQARREIRNAAARYRTGRRAADRHGDGRASAEGIGEFAEPAVLAVLFVALPLVLLVPGSTRPLSLAGIAVCAVWAAIALRAGLRRLRIRRGRRRTAGSAQIDDLYLYAVLRRRVESCASSARADRSYRRRAAATDLEYALDWLAAAQEELPRLR